VVEIAVRADLVSLAAGKVAMAVDRLGIVVIVSGVLVEVGIAKAPEGPEVEDVPSSLEDNWELFLGRRLRTLLAVDV
jgi:hypothetical protein